MHNILRPLRLVDATVVAFLLLLSLIPLVFACWARWAQLAPLARFAPLDSEVALTIGANIAASLGIILLAHACARRPKSPLNAVLHWYPVVAIFLVFKEVHIIQEKIGGSDWDGLLIAIDHAIFHVHPTQWLHHISVPILTELLQVAYASYYFIMLAVGIEVFLRHDRQEFSNVLFTIVYGFFLSYIGYIIFPAVGPRFTLHDFYAIDTDLPGIFVTTPIRNFLNAGESIPQGTLDALALAQRDAFPSGHVQMTLISLYLAHRYRLRSRFVLYLFGAMLIFSTVYLRYHYVVDVLGGVVFMLFTIWSAPKLAAWWRRTTTSD